MLAKQDFRVIDNIEDIIETLTDIINELEQLQDRIVERNRLTIIQLIGWVVGNKILERRVKTKMLKITIQVTEDKNKEKCTVKLINPKDLSKASSVEKGVCAMVINQIEKSLNEIKD